MYKPLVRTHWHSWVTRVCFSIASMDNVRIVLIESCSIECDMLFFPSLILVNVLYIYMIASTQDYTTCIDKYVDIFDFYKNQCFRNVWAFNMTYFFIIFILKERELSVYLYKFLLYLLFKYVLKHKSI